MIIWLASYPKSGNTWVRSIISSLLYSNDGNFNFELMLKVSQFPEKKYFKDFVNDFSNFNEIKESKLWWKEGWTPKHEGPFYVDLFQRVRNNGDLEGVYLLDGILNVGIAVEPQIQP